MVSLTQQNLKMFSISSQVDLRLSLLQVQHQIFTQITNRKRKGDINKNGGGIYRGCDQPCLCKIERRHKNERNCPKGRRGEIPRHHTTENIPFLEHVESGGETAWAGHSSHRGRGRGDWGGSGGDWGRVVVGRGMARCCYDDWLRNVYFLHDTFCSWDNRVFRRNEIYSMSGCGVGGDSLCWMFVCCLWKSCWANKGWKIMKIL